MTELCLPNTNKNTNNENNNYYDFTTLCSFIFSHPLYLSYFIFFSPYLYKLLSFLSPLFFTTFLLVLSLITTLVPLHSIVNSKDGVFVTAYNAVLEKLRPRFEDDEECAKDQPIEEFEVYKAVFDVPTIELSEENPSENHEFGENPDEISVEKVCVREERTVNVREGLSMAQETGDTSHEKFQEVEVKKHEETLTSVGSEVSDVKKTPMFGSLIDAKFSPRRENEQSSHYLGSYGSMRKEKEWRRTLACKLFEERHNWSNNKINNNNNVDGANNNDDGEEGMDLLWETPEAEIFSKGNKSKEEVNNKKGRKKDSKIIEDYLMKNESNKSYDQEEDYEEDYEDSGKICCLQALKLSAGKMNLSMGRPNLVKISKAFKGIGWLQSHVIRRQGKKGYK